MNDILVFFDIFAPRAQKALKLNPIKSSTDARSNIFSSCILPSLFQIILE